MESLEKDTGGMLKEKEEKLVEDIPSPKEALNNAAKDLSLTTSGITYPKRLEADHASLCLLSYNRSKFLLEGLNSLHQNPGWDYELIVHDDGSEEENVHTVLEEQLSTDKISTLIKNVDGHNQGQGTALNRMFNIASGDPIIKLDQDLTYHSGWLLEVKRLMTENPSIGLLGLLHYYHEPVDSRRTVTKRHDEWSEHTHILGSAFAMRRACWEELGPFDEHSEAFAEDYIMQRKVAESGKWKCALPKENLVENPHMGRPHSTVVNPDMSIQKIHTKPFVICHESA